MPDMHYDIVIVGASRGGGAAAHAAGEAGVSVCLLEPTEWTGGQFTSQGVCRPDEHRWIDTVGNASYREFRHRCRAHYRNNYRLSGVGAAQPLLDPGGPFNPHQPQFAVEPKVADAILKQMLSEAPTVHLRQRTVVTHLETSGDAVASVTARGQDGTQTRYNASIYLDATDLGDLLPLSLRSDEYVVGAEASGDTHEPGAPNTARTNWIQPITFCIALENRPAGEEHTIPEPPEYAALKVEQAYKLKDGAIGTMFAGDAWRTTMWNYRRYIDARNFDDPAFRYDLSMINTGSNDYNKASIPSGHAARDHEIITRARHAALGFLYWLQTECPRDEGGIGYPELRPNSDAFGTEDGVARYPYIRESRRIIPLERIVAQDVLKDGKPGPRADLFADACGIGTYAYMDGHALPGANMQGFWLDIYPAQIRAKALVPKRVTNVLAACKNIGTTHFTNGLSRLHPFEWNVGEAAGTLAAFSFGRKIAPRDVVSDGHLLRSYQRALVKRGVALFWWTDVPFGDPLFEAAQMAGATLIMTGDGNSEMRFNGGQTIGADGRAGIAAKVGRDLSAGDLTRAQVAQWLDAQGLS